MKSKSKNEANNQILKLHTFEEKENASEAENDGPNGSKISSLKKLNDVQDWSSSSGLSMK